MQYAIKPALAAVFAKVFYEQLGAGSDVDKAVSKGREALGLPIYGGKGSWSDRAFGTPVVYLQSEKAIIEMPPPPPPPPPRDDLGYDPNVKVPCPNPKCDSRVLPAYIMCLDCDHPVMICPRCLEQKDGVSNDRQDKKAYAANVFIVLAASRLVALRQARF